MTSTWTCPRCRASIEVGTPTAIPANCPRCAYPDPLPSGFEPPQADLEAEVGEEQQRIAAAAALDPSAPHPAIPVGVGPQGIILSAGQVDAGWLAIVLRQLLARRREATGKGSISITPRVTDEFAAEVAELYAQERWPMLCGCLVGVHGDTVEAIREAHPERRS